MLLLIHTLINQTISFGCIFFILKSKMAAIFQDGRHQDMDLALFLGYLYIFIN